ITSEMASLDISIPPRTHCSAATSCGGVRSKSPLRGVISATLTPDLPPRLDEGPRAPAPAANTVLAEGSDSLVRPAADHQLALCTGLWTACADTPLRWWTSWGQRWGRGLTAGAAEPACQG